MSETTRRGFLGVAGTAAVAAGGLSALPAICASPAFAAGPAELPVVNRPGHPAAEYRADSRALGVGPEPLNATVDCALHGREG